MSTENAETWVRLAARHMQEGKLDAAEGAASLAIVFGPNDVRAWKIHGVVTAKNGDHERAIELFLRALELAPGAIDLWTDLGECYVSVLDYPKAAAALERAVALDPLANLPAGRRARALIAKTASRLTQKS